MTNFPDPESGAGAGSPRRSALFHSFGGGIASRRRNHSGRGALRLAIAASILGLAGPAGAATFFVTNTGTSGSGSLHQAITDANLTAEPDVIEFDVISAGAVKTIGGTLPAITQPLTIDGYTQGAASPNSLPAGATNADIRIELDASGLVVGGAMLRIKAPAVVRGIAIKGIKNKGGVGIEVGAEIDDPQDAHIVGCFLGTDATGAVDGSAGTGIRVLGAATIGTEAVADRNLISGNSAVGIDIRGTDVVVLNNLVGLNANGVFALGNGTGISVVGTQADRITIGTKNAAGANVIAENVGDGINVQPTVPGGVLIVGNRIRDNGGLGIDLGADGVTANDEDDSDSGPNGLLNFAVLTFARFGGGQLVIEGHLQTSPGSYTLQFFLCGDADPSGFGEGELFLGTTAVTVPNEEGTTGFFKTEIQLPPDAPQKFLVSAVTLNEDRQTSEFSRAITAVEGGTELFVTNSSDSGTGSLRQAILDANQDADVNTIVFAIAGPMQAINSEGFFVVHPVIIDGFTKNGATPNTISSTTNAGIGVEIDGSPAPSGTVAFEVSSAGTVIRGLSIHSFPAGAIRSQDAEGLRIEGNSIGLDRSGVATPGNGGSGVVTIGNDTEVVIGGELPAQRNIISGSLNFGIVMSGTPALILNNVIGGNALGTEGSGNGAGGIRVVANGSVVGSDDPLLGNQIRDNGGAGIEVLNSSGTEILANSIFDNAGVGIDLDPFDSPGVTANDGVDDADSGANARQDFPELFAANLEGGILEVAGILRVPQATVDAAYTIRIFTGEECDESGHGEGQTFVGAADVELSGNAEGFAFELPVTGPVGPVFTATVTDRTLLNTSEFSECFPPEPPPSTCGDASGDGNISAVDAFLALAAAVGTGTCEPCRCDVNDSGAITAPDALLMLRAAVGQEVLLACPGCP